MPYAPLQAYKMLNSLNSLRRAIQKDAVDLAEWWNSFNTTYRGCACILVALLLMWEATKSSTEGERDRKFFLTGMAALGLLAYAVVLFSRSMPTN